MEQVVYVAVVAGILALVTVPDAECQISGGA